MLLSDFPGGGTLKEKYSRLTDFRLELCLKRKFEFREQPIEFNELKIPSMWAF